MSGERDAGDSTELDRDPPDGVAIEPATPDDRLDALRVLDAAMLETDPEVVDAAIDAGDALVARFTRTGAVVGALVATRPEPDRLHVDALAVRRSRRGRGIGSALVAAAVRRAERDAESTAVTAGFDADLRALYAGLGFSVRPARYEDALDPGATDAGAPDPGASDSGASDSGADRVAEGDADRLWGRRAADRATGGESP
ncbi:GNAT family N-acetyltransferase [Halorubrum lipolyticum]|uniref:GCN5-related N-acetyltransferase n=1 Tax=Halorubrum lipolyticum DSM 21995 TaxID=1227482 RepID=M0NUV0_9EURY|nr:GNAT family N-acetyltransferase [Halorubrum lipolyticum]EMA61353.1 GCN5-related N-acetyltransferase [Halorubrum lipolyticum DSM 21995]